MAAVVEKYNKRLEMLKSERTSFVALWRELSDYHLAHRGRFLASDVNKGYKRNTKQYNNTSRMAARTLASGMMAGITSPARPWFRLSTNDPDMREIPAVKHWLHRVQQKMYEVFSASNTYNALHQLYAELGVFGTAATGVFDDFENVIHCRPYTIGSYYLAAGANNIIDTFYREYQQSVGQVVKQFGIDNVSDHVKNQWKSGNTEAWVDLVHVIEPNDDRDNMSPLAKDMPVRSVYYEKGRQCANENKFLRESGFRIFPVMSPRWDAVMDDVYSTDCPGMTAIGDTKALQLGERKAYQALDKIVDPPLQGPSSLRNKVGKTLRNGEIVWTDANGKGLEPIYDFKPDLAAMMEMNNVAQDRIKRAFYEDLFLMLANSDRRQITAREVAEKHEEKLLMLGPVLERLHTELLDPLIDITFDKLQNAGVLPKAPKELEGSDLKVEYVSVLAQAQRMVAVGSLDRMAGYVGNLAGIWPEARHKFDALQACDEYADALGIAPEVVASDEVVAQKVQAEQQAQQAAMMAEQAQSMANTAKTVSEVPGPEDGNALNNMLRNAGLM